MLHYVQHDRRKEILINSNSFLGILPVVTPGNLAGHPCRVVGVVERAELGRNGRTQYRWLEYQIYQPATND